MSAVAGRRAGDTRPLAAAVLAVTLIALLLRLHGLTATSLWVDEGYTLEVVLAPAGMFWQRVLADTHPPLQYLLLRGWVQLFGSGEFALRSLGVVFGTLTVPVLFLIGRALAGPAVGLLAAALLALSSLHIQYSTEVRLYALFGLLAAVAMWGALRYALSPDDARAVRLGAAAYGLAVPLALATAAPAVFLIAGLSPLMLLGWWCAGRPRAAIGPWILAHAVIALALLAWLPLTLHLAGNARDLLAWAPVPGPRVIAEVAGALLAQRAATLMPAATAPLAAAAVGLIVAAGAWHWRRDAVRLGFAVLAGGLPMLLALLVSLAFQPIFLARVLLWLLLPICVLAALGALTLPLRAARIACTAALLLLNAAGAYAQHAYWARPDWRAAVRHIAAAATPEDRIAVPPPPGVVTLVAYYAPDLGERTARVRTVAELAGIADAACRIWFVAMPWHDRLDPARAAEILSATHLPRETRLFGGPIRVTAWTSRSAACATPQAGTAAPLPPR